MKKNILLVAILVSIVSCTKEISNMNTSTNNRLMLKSMSDFDSIYNELSKLGNITDLKFWAQNKNYPTLFESNNESNSQYPDIINTIFNKDSEFETKDSIILLDKFTIYAISKKDYNPENKLQVNKFKLIGRIFIQSLSGAKLRSTSMGMNNLLNHQLQFNQIGYSNCSNVYYNAGGLRKYVNEIYALMYVDYSTPIPLITSYLHFRAKMEYKGSSWKPAGEPREIKINITGNGNFKEVNSASSTIIPFTVNNLSFTCSNNQDIVLCEIHNVPYMSTPYWIVTTAGTVYQHVKGDLSTNAWTDSFVW